MKKAEVFEFYRRLAELDPEPRGELEWSNPYTLLVAVALSAQATDVSVNLATRRLFEIADSPTKMLELGEDGLRDHIRTIGLFNTKAKHVIALSQRLVDSFSGQVPTTREELQSLPGVGRKTANVVLNTAFGQPTIAVDTHVFRVGNRTGLASGKIPLDVELKLERITPNLFKQHAHHWLILHGRYICKARRPECWRCPVVDLCRFKPKNLVPPRGSVPAAIEALP
jgi:endonuclease-3